jgi:CheY-like chemotaxis protein
MADVVASGRRALSGLHMLVVDDDRDSREILRLLLAHYGASAGIATSAEAALSALQRLTPDVVLADIMLGASADGLWLRREAARQWPHVPFIAISGEDFSGEMLERAGFVAYLRKPVGHELLVDTVLSAVAR